MPDRHTFSFDNIQSIILEENPLEHWDVIRNIFASLHHDYLRFIVLADIPLRRFVRNELAQRCIDKKGKPVDFEVAKKIWKK